VLFNTLKSENQRFTMKYITFTGFYAFLTLSFLFCACGENSTTENKNIGTKFFFAPYGTPVLDGSSSDEAWENADWYAMDQNWLGTPTPDSLDFKGRFKVIWDENMLYILAEITDDTLVDTHSDGLVQYFDDDCLEVFVDEDASGGDHAYNYNAFAYHIALDNKVVDIAPDSSKRYYDDHCISLRNTVGNISVWEVGIKNFDGKNYVDGGENIPKTLKQMKKIGFALAYCDNDHSPEREHFMGSVPIEGQDKNRAWQDASLFGILELK
jgi:hypothetical protein